MIDAYLVSEGKLINRLNFRDCDLFVKNFPLLSQHMLHYTALDIIILDRCYS